MSNPEAYKTACAFLIFDNRVIQIPGSAFNGDIVISIITSGRKYVISQSEDHMLICTSFRQHSPFCIKSKIAVHMDSSGNQIASLRNDYRTRSFICSSLPHKVKHCIQGFGNITSISHI